MGARVPAPGDAGFRRHVQCGVDNGGKGPLLDMVLGIVGAVVGGAIFNALGAVPVTGFNLYSLFVAVVGSVVVLVIYHALVGRRHI